MHALAKRRRLYSQKLVRIAVCYVLIGPGQRWRVSTDVRAYGGAPGERFVSFYSLFSKELRSSSHIIYGSEHTCVQVCEILWWKYLGKKFGCIQHRGGNWKEDKHEFSPTGRKPDRKCRMTQEITQKEEMWDVANENKDVSLPDGYWQPALWKSPSLLSHFCPFRTKSKRQHGIIYFRWKARRTAKAVGVT